MTMFGLCQFHCYLTRGCESGHLSLPLCVGRDMFPTDSPQGRGRKKDGCLSQSRTQQFTHGAALWKRPLLWWGSPWIEGAVSQSQGNLWGTNLQPFGLPGPHLLSRIIWGRIYVGRSKRNVSYFFPWKCQQVERAEEHYLIVQILIYKALFFNRVSTISYAFLPVMNIIQGVLAIQISILP